MVLIRMSKLTSIVVFCASAVLCVNSQECDILGYYWKGVTKQLPGDALEAGIDEQGRPLFIGQAVVDDSMLPGKIYINESFLYVSNNGKEEMVESRVKVLCSMQTDSFEWKKANIDEHLNSTQLVIGGQLEKAYVYIGRIKHGEEMLVGKVVPEGNPQVWKLYVTSDGQSFPYETYDVLFFNGEIP